MPYGGINLGSDESCWWQVRVWDQDGRPSDYCQPSVFTMGLLHESDWAGQWLDAHAAINGGPMDMHPALNVSPNRSMMPHLAKLDFHCIQVECGLKNYSNDIVKVRQALGEEVCIFSNSHAITVIEQGDEAVWREDAHHQAKAIGKQRRFGVGHGTPTTWKTSPQRYRRYIDFMRGELASIVPPH